MAEAPRSEQTTITKRAVSADPEPMWIRWINHDIPAWLDKFKTFDAFDKAMTSAAASGEWKAMAYAMAAERWQVKLVHLPR